MIARYAFLSQGLRALLSAEPDIEILGEAANGWQALQWNFLSASGVDAPDAWANLIADGHPGGRGVTVAIVDTGVAYRNWRGYTRSPDFGATSVNYDLAQLIAKGVLPR